MFIFMMYIGTPHIRSPLDSPIVTPTFISLTCGQDVAVPFVAATILIQCFLFNGTDPFTFKVFKDGIFFSSEFSITLLPDANYYGTYTFIVSTEKCGHASAVSRILQEG